MKCQRCDGTGDVVIEKHICDCPECEGSGRKRVYDPPNDTYHTELRQLEEERRANRKELEKLSVANRFRLMAGLPLFENNDQP